MKPHFCLPSVRRFSLSSQPSDSLLHTLLAHKTDPTTALHLFKSNPPSLHTLAVLLHILTASPHTRTHAKSLLNHHVAAASSPPPPPVLLDTLLNSAKRFDFPPDSPLFSYLLNSYVRANRIRDAVDCFNRMSELGICVNVEYMNIVLSALVRRGMFGEARKLYGGMMERGDCASLHIMIRACLKAGKPEEAEGYFWSARARGVAADAALYEVAVEAVCKGNDLRLALVLLEEMRGGWWVASGRAYTGVIWGYV